MCIGWFSRMFWLHCGFGLRSRHAEVGCNAAFRCGGDVNLGLVSREAGCVIARGIVRADPSGSAVGAGDIASGVGAPLRGASTVGPRGDELGGAATTQVARSGPPVGAGTGGSLDR